MSAIGGKADMPFCVQMSAFDSKRTCDASTAASKRVNLMGSWHVDCDHNRRV
jgi:hypothetical protein